jgi:hypothetical protein
MKSNSDTERKSEERGMVTCAFCALNWAKLSNLEDVNA